MDFLEGAIAEFVQQFPWPRSFVGWAFFAGVTLPLAPLVWTAVKLPYKLYIWWKYRPIDTDPPESLAGQNSVIGLRSDFYRIASVIDATSLDVFDDKGLIRVWIMGLETPDLEDPLHKRAVRVLRAKLRPADPVFLKVYDFNPRWRRAIASVETPEGQDLTEMLARVGLSRIRIARESGEQSPPDSSCPETIPA
jgi:hypothetical protein